MGRVLRLLLLPLLLAAFPAAAQNAPAAGYAEEEEGTICLAIGHGWAGDNADIRDIERVPVPQGFREDFESEDECTRFQLIKESLVDWHLRFGSESSVTQALAYLERAYARGGPSPQRFGEEITDAWQDAQADLRRATKMPEVGAADYSAQGRFIQRSAPIQRLSALADATYGNFRFLAEQYLLAAEEHGSLALLDKADVYTRAVRAGGELLEALKNRDATVDLVTYDLDAFRTDDLEMRAAVLRARLLRTQQAIDTAEERLRASERPEYLRLAEHAFTGGENFCNLDDDAGEELEAICDADDDYLHEKVVSYLTARAMLDLVIGGDDALRGNDTFELIMRLLEAEERNHGESRCCSMPRARDLIYRLRLVRSECRLRAFPMRTPNLINFDGLDELGEAERDTPPYDEPTRFRRIALGWLALYGEWETQFAQRDDQLPSGYVRHAAFLRRTLADLDAIAQARED